MNRRQCSIGSPTIYGPTRITLLFATPAYHTAYIPARGQSEMGPATNSTESRLETNVIIWCINSGSNCRLAYVKICRIFYVISNNTYGHMQRHVMRVMLPCKWKKDKNTVKLISYVTDRSYCRQAYVKICRIFYINSNNIDGHVRRHIGLMADMGVSERV